MSDTKSGEDNYEISAELFRLTLAKLSQLKIAFTPLNYALIYYYLAGDDVKLNEQLDPLLNDIDQWTEEESGRIFDQFICNNNLNKDQAKKIRKALSNTVANILGMLIDLTGKTAISNSSLEKHLEHLSSTKDPSEVLDIASEIIADTRSFVDETKHFESSLINTTGEIEALKTELDDARKQATKDALTGLNNRRAFDHALSTAIKSQQTHPETFCLLMIDIDFFKKVNDSYGHLVGDKVLVGLSQVLFKKMRGGDYLCRYGGEEFSIILTNTQISGAFTVAENLRKAIEKLRLKHVKTDQQIGQVTISVGVACYRQGESDISIIDRCDKALYRAKSLGRNRTVIAD